MAGRFFQCTPSLQWLLQGHTSSNSGAPAALPKCSPISNPSVNLFQPRSICFNLGQFDFFLFLRQTKKIFFAPSIFSSSSFSLSPLYLPHLLFNTFVAHFYEVIAYDQSFNSLSFNCLALGNIGETV